MEIVIPNSNPHRINVENVNKKHIIVCKGAEDWYIITAVDYKHTEYKALCLSQSFTEGNCYASEPKPLQDWLRRGKFTEMHAFENMRDAIKFLSVQDV